MTINRNTAFLILSVLLLLAVMFSLGLGAVSIPVSETIGLLLRKLHLAQCASCGETNEAVLFSLRLPRVLLSLLVGGALAVSGASLQGIFRNPLVDSGLIGISSGASLFAALYIVAGSAFPFLYAGSSFSLAIAAFCGAGITTWLVYRISRFQSVLNITLLILAGVALNAIAGSLTGLISYLADEAQLRDLSFWQLGNFGSATYEGVGMLAIFVLPATAILCRIAGSLNAFALGEDAAWYAGVNTRAIKLAVFLCSTAMVGASVSLSGVIGFVGLVIPHILRHFVGPDHRTLLPLSFLAGAFLMVVSDLLSRTLMMPTEIPVGIITALAGTPVLIGIILRQKRRLAL